MADYLWNFWAKPKIGRGFRNPPMNGLRIRDSVVGGVVFNGIKLLPVGQQVPVGFGTRRIPATHPILHVVPSGADKQVGSAFGARKRTTDFWQKKLDRIYLLKFPEFHVSKFWGQR